MTPGPWVEDHWQEWLREWPDGTTAAWVYSGTLAAPHAGRVRWWWHASITPCRGAEHHPDAWARCGLDTAEQARAEADAFLAALLHNP